MVCLFVCVLFCIYLFIWGEGRYGCVQGAKGLGITNREEGAEDLVH